MTVTNCKHCKVSCSTWCCDRCWRSWRCLACGQSPKSLEAVTVEGLEGQQYWGCLTCKSGLDALPPCGRQALVSMDKIASPGMIWAPGNSYPHKTGLLPQPALAMPSVCSNVYIGDLDDCMDMRRLHSLGVGFVIILCPEQLRWKPYDTLGDDKLWSSWGIQRRSWAAEDNSSYDFTNQVMFNGALDDMKHMTDRCVKVLVCCWGGVNRSAFLVIGFLVFHCNVPLMTAVHSVTQQRGTVLINQHFRFLLVEACLKYGAKLCSADFVPPADQLLNHPAATALPGTTSAKYVDKRLRSLQQSSWTASKKKRLVRS